MMLKRGSNDYLIREKVILKFSKIIIEKQHMKQVCLCQTFIFNIFIIFSTNDFGPKFNTYIFLSIRLFKIMIIDCLHTLFEKQ